MKTVKNAHPIRILSNSEIDDLYARPQLKKDEMTFLFDLSGNETAILNTGLSMERKIDAIIQLGFFREKKRFFDFTLSDVSGEAHYVSELYFGETKLHCQPEVFRHKWGYPIVCGLWSVVCVFKENR